MKLNDRFEIVIPGEPVPWSRTGSNLKRRYTPAKQFQYMKSARLMAQAAWRGAPPWGGAIHLRVIAEYGYPPSWTRKRCERTIYKTSRPDSDNLVKIVQDALKNVVWFDDAQVAVLSVIKRYAQEPSLTLIAEPLADGGFEYGEQVRA